MLAVILDRGNTWVLNIEDNLEISVEDLKREWNSRYLAWFVNNEGSKQILLGLPVSRYFMHKVDGEVVEITREQAIQLLDMLDQLRSQKQGTGKKK